MELRNAINLVITPGLNLLAERMRSPEAAAMLLAIGLQESRFTHRRQIRGPARGFYQFEQGGGIAGVLRHPSTREEIRRVLDLLVYDHEVSTSYVAVEHNDALATVFARLLLWTLPHPLPRRDQAEVAWNQYIEAWRPGKPHRNTWDAFYHRAWEVVRS